MRRGERSAWRPTIALVSEFAPPTGGMAVQAGTLCRRLREDGFAVVPVRTNPQFGGLLRPLRRVRFVRGAIGWCRFAWALRRLRRADLVHVFAASWLTFFLFAAPTVTIARALGRGVIIHYHGGGAAAFLRRWGWLAKPFLRAADELVVPSRFLAAIFAARGLQAEIIANPVDVAPVPVDSSAGAPVILSCRNLTPVYDIATAIDAFARLAETCPGARLLIAGEGPERGNLERRVAVHGLSDRVEFLGGVPHAEMAAVRERATMVLNTSRVDNQPVSLIEAMAAGLPIVSTDAGGIPDLVRNGVEALLAPVGDADALATRMRRVATEPSVRGTLAAAGLARSRAYRWSTVGRQWRRLYARQIVAARRPTLQKAPTGEVRS